jgi:isopenicillin N synthase-like dioxygenase
MAPQPELPLLDIKNWKDSPQRFVKDLRTACRETGCFVLRHNIPLDLVERQLKETRKFFQEHSLQQKSEISYQHSRAFRGYMPFGVENTAGKVDIREQIEYAADYPKEILQDWPAYCRLKSQNPWPRFQPSLQETTEAYAAQAVLIADQIRRALCEALSLPPSRLDDMFNQPHWVVKLISYPASAEENESQQGVGAHTDTNFLTLVLQDVPGLQVFQNDEWVDVPDIGPGSWVCNLGEQAEILSSGFLRATPHRVVSTSRKPRTSIALFYNPCLEATVEPLVDFENPLKAWKRPQSQDSLLTVVGENTLKSLARSHPTVFSKHYADCELTPEGRVIPSIECNKRKGAETTGSSL